MKIIQLATAASLALASTLVGPPALADDPAGQADENEQAIPADKVPEAARTALLSHATKLGGTIAKYEQATRQGKTIYEAEITAQGKTTRIAVDANGNLLK